MNRRGRGLPIPSMHTSRWCRAHHHGPALRCHLRGRRPAGSSTPSSITVRWCCSRRGAAATCCWLCARRARLLGLRVEAGGGNGPAALPTCPSLVADDSCTVGIMARPAPASRCELGHPCRPPARRAAAVAVSAVDLSNLFTGGDRRPKVRMQRDDDPTSHPLHGDAGTSGPEPCVRRRARARAGHGWVVVETVGEGQVEVDGGAVDTTVGGRQSGPGGRCAGGEAGLLETAMFVAGKVGRPGAESIVATSSSNAWKLAGHGVWNLLILETVASEGRGVSRAARRLHRRLGAIWRRVRRVVSLRTAHRGTNCGVALATSCGSVPMMRAAARLRDLVVDQVADGSSDGTLRRPVSDAPLLRRTHEPGHRARRRGRRRPDGLGHRRGGREGRVSVIGARHQRAAVAVGRLRIEGSLDRRCTTGKPRPRLRAQTLESSSS